MTDDHWKDGWLKGQAMQFRYLALETNGGDDEGSLIPTTRDDPDASVVEVLFRKDDGEPDKRVLLVSDKSVRVPASEQGERIEP